MIVTCPDCSTRYLVDPRALGAAGRRVRCANCASTWHQSLPEDAPRPIERPRYEAPQPAPTLEAEPRVRTESPARLPAVSPAKRPPWGLIGSILIPVLVVAGFLGAAVLFRDRVVALWPPAAKLYAVARLPVNEPGAGLVISHQRSSNGDESGAPALIIEGQVDNVTGVAIKVPKLRIEIKDINAKILQHWTFTVTDEPLLPGASIPFRTSTTQLNKAAVGSSIDFAGPDE